jgi:hypothetical protein
VLTSTRLWSPPGVHIHLSSTDDLLCNLFYAWFTDNNSVSQASLIRSLRALLISSQKDCEPSYFRLWRMAIVLTVHLGKRS